jgi:hypothetical protein
MENILILKIFTVFYGEYKVEYLENRESTFDETYIEMILQVRGIKWYHQIGNPGNPCQTENLILDSVILVNEFDF